MPEWMTVGALLAYLRPFYPAWDSNLVADLIKQFDLPRDANSATFPAACA
jgi:ABC-2 type transport system ATP-binding protein